MQNKKHCPHCKKEPGMFPNCQHCTYPQHDLSLQRAWDRGFTSDTASNPYPLSDSESSFAYIDARAAAWDQGYYWRKKASA
jgi:hypothetical protein